MKNLHDLGARVTVVDDDVDFMRRDLNRLLRCGFRSERARGSCADGDERDDREKEDQSFHEQRCRAIRLPCTDFNEFNDLRAATREQLYI